MKKKLSTISAIIASTIIASTAFGQINSATMYKGFGNIPGGSGSYYGTNVNASGYHAFAGGRNSTATGAYSFAQGYYSISSGAYSVAMGVRNQSTNTHSFTLGIDLQSTANRSMTLGSGVVSGVGIGTDLINNIQHSLMVGFNSDTPTFFVGPGSGLGTTGNVGIATTSPNAKLDVNGTGHFNDHVGIGTNPHPAFSLFINTDNSIGILAQSTNWTSGVGAELRGGSRGAYGIAGTYATTGTPPTTAYGLWGIGVVGTSIACGVHGDGTGSGTGYAYGVWGTATGGGSGNYGVYGTGSGSGFYAGYFAGNVYTTGLYLSSDRKLKNNIKPLTNTEKFLLLEPKEYTYRTNEYSTMNLEEGTQMGFIAQDVEKVLPNLVRTTVQPPKVDEDGEIIEEGTTFKAVNYVGLIPLMTATIQEQNETIQKQEEALLALKERVNRLENNSSIESEDGISEAILFQNVPNPFNESTMIQYSLPSSVSNAKIMIFNLNGEHKLSLEIDVTANGRTILSAHQLSPGMYVYVLIADGKEVSSKKMIITE